jgi:hypothetical protein
MFKVFEMSNELSLDVRPSYITPENAKLGTEVLQQYVKPIRAKIVQSSSREPFKSKFEEGDVVAVPNLQLLLAHGGTMLVTPIFFFPEWCVWNPLQMAGLPTIRERSFDPRSEIAALSRDNNKRRFPCPENTQLQCQAQEHLNLICILENVPDFEEIPVVFTFLRKEYKTGSMWLNLIQGRKAPMGSMVFEVGTASRKNDKGEWIGFDIDNPAKPNPAWIPADRFESFYKPLFEKFQKAHADNVLIVEHDDLAGADIEEDEVQDPTGRNF